MKISVIGFGKLGASTGYFLSKRKFQVYAFDVDAKVIDGFKKKKPPFFEKSIKDLVPKYSFRFCTNIEDAVKKTDISYIIVPTPSKKDNSFSNSYVTEVLDQIFKNLKKKRKKHSIILTSTVSPGSCNQLINYFEKKYKIQDTRDFRFYYNPYFIALGSILNNLENPDLLLIGCKKENVIFYKNFLKKIYKSKKIKFKFLNHIEAEISKISINCYVTMKISFSNEISQIADKIKTKINSKKILDAIGTDTRIGKEYLGIGPMFSGPCFPRDNLAMSAFLKKHKLSNNIFDATEKINNLQLKRYFEILSKIKEPNRVKLGFAGLTYKSGTDLFTDSPAFYIIKKYKNYFKHFNGFDPYFNKNQIKKISKNFKIQICTNINQLVKKSDIILLSYPDKKFLILKKITGKIILDPWDYLNAKNKNIIIPGIN